MLATSAAAQDVTWDYAKGTDFTRLKTYAWTAEHPDALVAYYAAFAKNFALNEIGLGWGGLHFGGTWTNRARVEEIVVGSMIVDIIDAGSRTIVWRGTASKDIDVHAKPEDVEKTLAPVPSMGLVSARGLGSGTIISSDGSVLTAAHVVQTADRVGVELQDGRLFAVRVVASSPRADVALLKMESPPPDLIPARLGNSDSLMTGDEVAVIGAPFGLGYSLTAGHVSGRLLPKQTVSGVPLEFIHHRRIPAVWGRSGRRDDCAAMRSAQQGRQRGSAASLASALCGALDR